MDVILHSGGSRKAVTPVPKNGQDVPTARSFAEAARRLGAIGEPVRLQIFWWLAQGERSVTDLCGLLGMSQQAVTHHLNIAKLKRLVAFRRQGRWNLYHLTEAGREVVAAAHTLIGQCGSPSQDSASE